VPLTGPATAGRDTGEWLRIYRRVGWASDVIPDSQPARTAIPG
jgi:hypothetical protein